ncbi:MAG: hypothetical protein GY950_27425 [bacterium]|nr:hypothetical protein [bacterium]
MIKKNTIFTILLFAGSICFAGILVESLMRLFYEPASIFNLDEIGDYLKIYTYTPPANKSGFRETELNDDVFQNDHRRILFLGDSFTFGYGVKKGEDRFSDIIENRLNRDSQKNGFKYRIFNAATIGTAPKDWVKDLKKLLPGYKPQSVFAIFFLRDGKKLCTYLISQKKKIKSIKAKYKNTSWYK